MDRYAVIGSPISHSLSPRIHTLFAEQTGQQLEYTAIEVQPETFFGRINELVEAGYKGLNVTVPLKQLAWEMADNCAEAADRAKSVNTLRFDDNGMRCGFNTDGQGLLQDLSVNHNIELRDKRILLLGAGGAVRGVLTPLLSTLPASITIANRTVSKAEQLALEFSDLGSVTGNGYESLSGQTFDIIINGTSTGLDNDIPPLPENILAGGGIAYDMFYAQQATAFVRWGQAQNAAKSLDGLGMLVEQAAAAFQIWRAASPDTTAVIKALRN